MKITLNLCDDTADNITLKVLKEYLDLEEQYFDGEGEDIITHLQAVIEYLSPVGDSLADDDE